MGWREPVGKHRVGSEYADVAPILGARVPRTAQWGCLMPRIMSVSHTTQAVIERRKTQTRRSGWRFLKPGDTIDLSPKAMGLPKGSKIQRIATVRIAEVRREPLNAITQADVDRECLDGATTPAEFVALFCGLMGGTPDQEITVITWEYVEGGRVLNTGGVVAPEDGVVVGAWDVPLPFEWPDVDLPEAAGDMTVTVTVGDAAETAEMVRRQVHHGARP